MHWLRHPAINIAYICELLYGAKDKNTTSKFHQKLNGKYGHRKTGFTEEEQQRLAQIKQQLLTEIQSESFPGSAL